VEIFCAHDVREFERLAGRSDAAMRAERARRAAEETPRLRTVEP
jgi:hypothetical protein